MKTKLNEANYFSTEANRDYWSVSQFKAFNRCEAAGLAESLGIYEREETDALLIGSYVDAYFTGDFDDFMQRNQDKLISKRGGGLLAKFQGANGMIQRVESDPLMMEYLEGSKQVILTAELFGVPWKIKIDVHGGNRLVDLKTVRDFEDVYDKGYGWRSWVEYWGYDIQGAIYQKVEQIAMNRAEPLPFYLASVTKEKTPDIKIIQIPQHILDAALHMVEAKIDRFDLIKSGEVEPIRCEKCDWCKSTKVLTAPEVYEIEEAED